MTSNTVIKYFILSLAIGVLSIPQLSFAQPWNTRHENQTYSNLSTLYTSHSTFHTSIRPYLLSDIDSLRLSEDSMFINSLKGTSKQEPRTIKDHLFNSDLITFHQDDFEFTINPLFDFSYGSQNNTIKTWTNTRAILVEGAVGPKFAFSTRFYENQAVFPDHIQNTINLWRAVPGQGQPRSMDGAMDYASASGYISYTPGKYFNFQLGHGKNFFGDGYRSFMLSDQALFYPYFKITSTIWKFKYVNMWTQFNHPYGTSTHGLFPYPKKYGTYHYLSFAGGKRWNLSLFEAIIWQAQDSTGYRGFEFNYINPMIFYRPVEFTLSSPDNAFMGTNFSFIAHDQLTLYTQFVIDEFRFSEIKAGNGWFANKYAWQIGFKSFNLFNIENLYLQAEYNMVRPYMYTHYLTTQNYSHNNEPLAYAFGANTKELLFIGKYNYKRLYFNVKYNRALFGLDENGLNYGKNIFLSYQDYANEYGNYIGQGLATNFKQIEATLSFLVNPVTNMNIFFNYTHRITSSSAASSEITWFNFGFRTSLRNLYYDFQ